LPTTTTITSSSFPHEHDDDHVTSRRPQHQHLGEPNLGRPYAPLRSPKTTTTSLWCPYTHIVIRPHVDVGFDVDIICSQSQRAPSTTTPTVSTRCPHTVVGIIVVPAIAAAAAAITPTVETG
jgi:hypothetical protein